MRHPLAVAVVALTTCALVALTGCSGDSKKSSTAASAPAAPSAAPGPVTALQQQFVDVVKSVSPKVVQIQTPDGLGSGVVFDGKGNIVTNAHVVGTSRDFQVTLGAGRKHKATLVGSYPQGDLAVVHLTDAKPAPATFADSSKIQVGEFALAVGNPLGLRSSVTEGIVSSVGRTVPEGNGAVLTSAIQTSAEINPGNSGGALVDIEGRVIGIPTLAAVDPQLGGTRVPGIGFAIPSNTARSVAAKLVAGRVPHARTAYLGVSVSTIVGGGVLVRSVQPGGPADKAGIRPGDLILSIGGQPTPSTDALLAALATHKPGEKVDVSLIRQGGRPATVSVTLGSQEG
jgi:putative serine protease PepD